MDFSVVAEKGLIVGERLGQGSYGTVYKVYNRTLRQNGTRQVLALKCISREKICMNQSAQDNMVREIEILKRLSPHPNIVRLIDFLWDKQSIFLIMEYCNAGDLSQFIRRRKEKSSRNLPEPVTRKFLQQLASAVQYLRRKQISHMDLKPQNILLSIIDPCSITLKLADFGFATRLRYGDIETGLRGSPLYMAPEILKQIGYDARVGMFQISCKLCSEIFIHIRSLVNWCDFV